MGRLTFMHRAGSEETLTLITQVHTHTHAHTGTHAQGGLWRGESQHSNS